VKYVVSVSTFEDDGAHWVRLHERRAESDAPGALPYIGQSVTFCGNTAAAAAHRAVEFCRNAAAALLDAAGAIVDEAPAPALSYQVLGAQGGKLVTLRTLWARDDNDARAQAGELPPGVYLFREVERASPGKGGVI
jgi:hypothetical protein